MGKMGKSSFEGLLIEPEYGLKMGSGETIYDFSKASPPGTSSIAYRGGSR